MSVANNITQGVYQLGKLDILPNLKLKNLGKVWECVLFQQKINFIERERTLP